jgi:CelD/BcsL family acetyltransferase involved in cellulose biosynthesis
MPTIRAKTSRHALSAALAMAWRSFCRDAFDAYRPELHYMRGPGPKWHAKHAAPADAAPAAVRVAAATP